VDRDPRPEVAAVSEHGAVTRTQALDVAAPATGLLQRMCDCGEHAAGGECAECREEREHEVLQRAPATVARPAVAPPIVHHVLGESGRALDRETRSDMEASFGCDFADVRVHADDRAGRSARAVGAHAYTVGPHVVFGSGRYAPTTEPGRTLLAHELAHVVQQRRSPARAAARDGLEVAPPYTADEAQAEAEAAAVAARASTGDLLPPLRAARDATAAAPLRNAQTIIDGIEDELDDVFFGIDNVWPSIRKEPKAERDKVRADWDLERRVEKRASPMDLLKTYLLLTYQTEDLYPPQYKTFLAATDILGTHEEQVYTVLRGVTSAERAEMRAMPGFRQVIVDEMSGRELDKALGLLDENIEQSGSATTTPVGSVHLEDVERYKLDVEAAGENLDEAQRQIKAAVDDEGSDRIINDTALWAIIADHFDIEELWYLRMITRAGSRQMLVKLPGEDKPYVEIIWEAVKGWGTREKPLIDELHHVFVSPTEGPKLTAEQTLLPMLEDELSGGELTDALAAIGSGGARKVGIRDDLERAIDRHDMDRIRKLLGDPALPGADLAALRYDPKILDELGEELSGPQMCEAVLLLKYGSTPIPAYDTGLLAFMQKKPIDVAGAEAFLNGLSDADKTALLGEPGVYFMLSSSGLPYADMAKLLAAIRPSVGSGRDLPGAAYREKGAEGTFKTHTESVKATLPVEFATSEIRIVVRVALDKSHMHDRDKLDDGTLEDWGRAVDRIWNGRFVLRSGPSAFPLVFVLYTAEGLASPNTIHVYDWQDRSYRLGSDLYLYLEGYGGEGLDPEVVAHEFGHMVGYPDEYALPPGEYKRLTGETATQPRTSVKALMGSHSESTKVELRYAGPATEAVNAVRDAAKYPDPFVLERAK
jgi:Domain of unknown function (DUF4157)